MNTTHIQRRNLLVPLHRHSVQSLHNYKKIVCEKGILWLTQSGDPGDYILMPGDQFAGKKHGKVLIEALHDAIMRVDK